MAYRFILVEKAVFPVLAMCNALEVSASGYYDWVGRPLSKRAKEDLEIIEILTVQHASHKRRYGSRRHKESLIHKVGRNRIRRLMKVSNLVAKQRRRFVVTTKSDHDDPVAPNVLNREFQPPCPNHSWVGDITYLPTCDGFLYLATIIDLYSRKVIGWSISERMTKQLVLDAFGAAVGRRACAPGVLFHSDRGSQYTSADYRKILRAHGIQSSMSRRGNCWDNAVAESFFATLEKELLVDLVGCGREKIRQEVVLYIEGYYNQQRIHSSISYETPVNHEKKWNCAQPMKTAPTPLWVMVPDIPLPASGLGNSPPEAVPQSEARPCCAIERLERSGALQSGREKLLGSK